ncbi:Hypothetical_protein [Hexamita inflata]|uniref:Hypothetical_protein n=1 Tax=Hexamita inflata TaxID=28002 RepID=A0ABP1H947_9EUKA
MKLIIKNVSVFIPYNILTLCATYRRQILRSNMLLFAGLYQYFYYLHFNGCNTLYLLACVPLNSMFVFCSYSIIYKNCYSTVELIIKVEENILPQNDCILQRVCLRQLSVMCVEMVISDELSEDYILLYQMPVYILDVLNFGISNNTNYLNKSLNNQQYYQK